MLMNNARYLNKGIMKNNMRTGMAGRQEIQSGKEEQWDRKDSMWWVMGGQDRSRIVKGE